MEIISRANALSLGLKFYYTGKPCKRGHVSERYTTNHECVECSSFRNLSDEAKEYQTAYRSNNKDKIKKRNAKYYAEHAEEIKKYHVEYFPAYYAKNADKLKNYQAAYWLENTEKLKRQRADYYAKNSDRIKQQHAEWKKNHPDKVARMSRSRRFKFEHQTPKWSENDSIEQIYKKRDELNEIFGTNLVVDHIIPITSPTVCGLHCHANLQLLDSELNSIKGNRYQTDW